VVVLDGRERCDDGALTYILVAPTSTKVNRVSRYHQILEKGQGELKERTVVLLDLIQPIPRQAFTRRIGQLLPAELERLQAILLANLGLLADSADTGTEWADDLTDREG
jgi:mRNA-degrading endonuclease toxin of MazEF toxin-antitoxin module